MCWIAANKYGVICILHLLDDFLTIDKPTSNADKTFNTMIFIFNNLGIPLSESKVEGPVTCIDYLGIILNSEKMESRLPRNKVNRIIEFIHYILSKRSCIKRELLQLLGHMNFASRVILAGRAFVSFLLNLASSVKELHHYVHINRSYREDLIMWVEFFTNWNAVSMFYEHKFTSCYDIKLHTDAASTAGSKTAHELMLSV